MPVPTPAEEYSKLTEYIRKAQESAAMLAHLEADTSPAKARQWLVVSEMFKRVLSNVISVATQKVQ